MSNLSYYDIVLPVYVATAVFVLIGANDQQLDQQLGFNILFILLSSCWYSLSCSSVHSE